MLFSMEDGNNSIRIESIDVVWVVNEFVVLIGDLIVDEMLVFLIFVVVGLRNEKIRRFKFFG